MSDFAEDIVYLEEAAGVGTFGATIFATSKSVIPKGDGPFLSIRETGGTSPLRTQNSVAVPAYQRPSAQLVARASKPVDAKSMARAAYNALVGVRNRMVNGVYYREINPVQEPFDIGLDAQERIQYAFNVNAVKRPT